MEEDPQMLIPQDVALGVEGDLQAVIPLDVALDVEEYEAYELGFVFLVALHIERLSCHDW